VIDAAIDELTPVVGVKAACAAWGGPAPAITATTPRAHRHRAQNGSSMASPGRLNEVYSWDITKLAGPAKWTSYYLYVIIDIYSRYVTGWMFARAERAHLAERLLADTIVKQGVARDQLTVHADRGASMASKPVAREPVHDAQVPAHLPRPVRFLRGRQGVLQLVLRLVQRRAPPFRHRVPHAR
jgi:transposase InsO family protein